MLLAKDRDLARIARPKVHRDLMVLGLSAAQLSVLGGQHPDRGLDRVAQNSDVAAQVLSPAALEEPFVETQVQSGVAGEPGVLIDGLV